MQVVLTIPKLKRPARSFTSLMVRLVCLHLPADADVRIIKKRSFQSGFFERRSLIWLPEPERPACWA